MDNDNFNSSVSQTQTPASQPQVSQQATSPSGAVVEEPVKVSPGKDIFKKLFQSKFVKTTLITLGMVFFLIGLWSFVVNNLNTAGGRVDLTWWGSEHDTRVYENLIREYQEKNPNVSIKYEKLSKTDYRERLSSALAAGKGPDIFEIHNTWPAMFKSHLSKIPSSIMSNDEYKKSFYPIVSTNFALGNGYVAIPLEYDAITLFINEEIFASGAKEPPTSWDDLRALSVLLTQKDPRGQIVQAGAALGITDNVEYWPDVFGLMLLQNKVNPLKPEGVFAEDVFSFYRVFNKKSWDDTMPPSTEAFSKGKLAMYFGPTREAINIVKNNPEIRFRTVKLPQLARNNPNDQEYSYATYWAQSVSSKSKVQKEAWNFLKFMSQPDSLTKINLNIKSFETFERAYPRPEMNTPNMEDRILGSIIQVANGAVSSFLADHTNDGESGINSKVNDLYKKLIDKWESRGEKTFVQALAKDLVLALSAFGITIK